MKVANDILIPELARLLNEQKEVRFTPSGVSMRPFIEGDKDSVILASMNRQPQRGDILLAQVTAANGNKTYVLHRLVRIENHQSPGASPRRNGESGLRLEGQITNDQSPMTNDQSSILYVLQGDGNLSGEETCTRNDIIGRVIAIETPQGRRKRLTRGIFWHRLLPLRRYLLKIYRHSWLKWKY